MFVEYLSYVCLPISSCFLHFLVLSLWHYVRSGKRRLQSFSVVCSGLEQLDALPGTGVLSSFSQDLNW